MPVYNTITQEALDLSLLKDRSFDGFNNEAYEIPQFSVGAWAVDGSVTLLDCTNPAFQKFVGIANVAIPSHSRGLYVQRGVVANAITGLGAAAGDTIYVGVTAGTLVASAPFGPGITAIAVGVAEPNPTTGLVTDLRVDLAATSGGGGGGGVTMDDVNAAILAAEAQYYFSEEVSFTIPPYRAVCWGTSDQILAGDATDPTKIDIAGISVGSIAPGNQGPVQYTGTIRNACLGLGAAAGQPVLLAEGDGGILTLASPSNPSSSSVIVGHAVPRSGTAGPANDLLLDIQRTLIL